MGDRNHRRRGEVGRHLRSHSPSSRHLAVLCNQCLSNLAYRTCDLSGQKRGREEEEDGFARRNTGSVLATAIRLCNQQQVSS